MNKNNVINFIIFQINWAICVFAAAKGYPWLGPMIVFIWCLIHTYMYRSFILVELPILLITGCIGYLVDSFLVVFNFIEFPLHAQFGYLSPLWMVALWVSFSTTFRHSMSWLREKYILASFFALIGGPFAYLAGQKIGAINGLIDIPNILVVGILWAIVFPSILYTLNRIEKKYGN